MPKQFDPTGTYSEPEIDRTIAFRLLAHAEIEWYIEEIVVETANKVFSYWQHDRLLTRPLVAMVAYVGSYLGDVPTSLSSSNVKFIDDRLKASRDWLNTYAKSKNNGIKRENILSLLLPIGINESEINETWLATTNSFGSVRGQVAHTSNRVYNALDPKSEYDTVLEILKGLFEIDNKLFELTNHGVTDYGVDYQ